MNDRVVLRPELQAIFGGVTTETIRVWIKNARIPKPDAAITRRTVGWKASTLRKAGIAVPDQASPPTPAESSAAPADTAPGCTPP